MPSKEQIMSEIQRTALENEGKPLGMSKFEGATGIRKSDWFGKYWAKWSEAVAEAGYPPNPFGPPDKLSEKDLLKKLVELVRNLGHFPSRGQLMLARSNDSTFPSHNAFRRRLGSRRDLVQKLVDFCSRGEKYQDVLEICSSSLLTNISENETPVGKDNMEYGFVYLLKSGKYYKIGRSNDAGRRNYELNIQLPKKADLIHRIRTDDPAGIEAYWHKRFLEKRKGGEWFELHQNNIRAFKRRSFM